MMFGRRNKVQDQPVRQPRNTIEEQGYAFRRSRTLTGSASSQVETIVESRAQLKSPRLRAQELRSHRRKLSAGLVGACFAIAGCFWLLDQYTVVPNVVPAQDTLRVLDAERYQKAASKYFGSHPFERFRFALNATAFDQTIRRELPEVSSSHLANGDGIISTDMVVAVRKPVAVWKSDNQRLYVDQAGMTFAENYYPEPTVVIEDQSGVSSAGSTSLVASSRLLTFAGQLVAGIDSSGVGNVAKVVIPLGALRQLDVTLTGKPYSIKTHMDRDPAGQVFDVVNAVKYFDSQQIIPQYIDVRVEGKAFYR